MCVSTANTRSVAVSEVQGDAGVQIARELMEAGKILSAAGEKTVGGATRLLFLGDKPAPVPIE